MLAPDAIDWFICRDGREYGPLSQVAVATFAAERRLAPTDLLWCTGLARWVEAADVPGLITTRHTARVTDWRHRITEHRPSRILPSQALAPRAPVIASDSGAPRRTPLSAFAPQPRRMLLSEALDAARGRADPLAEMVEAPAGSVAGHADATPPPLPAPAAHAAPPPLPTDPDDRLPLSAVIARSSTVPERVSEPVDQPGDMEAPRTLAEATRALSSWTSGLAYGLTGGIDRVVSAGAGHVQRLREQLPAFGPDAFWKALDAFDTTDLVARFADALERHDVRTPADLLNDDRMDVVSAFLLENLPMTVRWGVLLACGEDGFRRNVVYRMRDQLRVWIGPQRQDADIRGLLHEALQPGRSGAAIDSGWAEMRDQVVVAVETRYGGAAVHHQALPAPAASPPPR